MNFSLPLFPLGTVLFPGMLLPLHIFEERYRRLIGTRYGEEPIFGVVLTKQGREVADEPAIHEIGTAAELVGAGRYPDGRYDLIVRGSRRFRVHGQNWSTGYLTADVEWLEEPPGAPGSPSLAHQAGLAFEQFLTAFERATGADISRQDLPVDPTELAYALCARIPLDTWERQRLLEQPTTTDRLIHLLAIVRRERDLLLATGAGGATVDRPGLRFTAN